MSKKRLMRGIKRITTVVSAILIVLFLKTNIAKEIWYTFTIDEFMSSQAAYQTIYGDDTERLEMLDKKARSLGYDSFNDYRINKW